ncbi:hypothetical protein KKE45_03560 [Patescibacteria group bacterium]|nr:hypothetical protein [Patescibacteria group bacterium]
MVKKKLSLDKVLAEWCLGFPSSVYEFSVKKGEMVNREDVLARSKKEEFKEFLADEWLLNWSGRKIRDELLALKGKKIKKGDLLLKKGKLFKKKLLAPVDGEIVDVDEFCNLKVKVEIGERENLLSPVKARVSKISKDELILEFEAWEVSGVCIFSGKVWANMSLFCLENVRDLGENMDGGVVFTKFLDEAFVVKAGVLGVGGIVWISDKEVGDMDFVSELPVLKISSQLFDALKLVLNKDKRYRVLFNSESKRLLVVVE